MSRSGGPASSALRDLGNASFKAKKWQEAIDHYSEAIEADYGSREAEHVAALFCNRAAAYLNLYEYDLAQLDVDIAKRLRPDWYRAWERQAKIEEAREMNEEASDSYATASRLASEMHSGESHRISTNLAMKAMETRTKPDRVRTRADLDYLSNKEPKFRRAGDLDHRIAARVGIRALNVVLKGWRVFYEEYDWGSGPEDLKGLWDVLDVFYQGPEPMHFHNEDLTNDPNRGKVRIALDQELDVIEEMAPISRPEELAKDIATLVRRDGWESFRGGKRWVLTFMRLHMIQAVRARQKQDQAKILVFAGQPIPVVEHLLELIPDLKEGALGREIAEDLHRCRAAVLDAHTWILIDDLTEGPVDTLDMATSLAETCIDYSVRNMATVPEPEDPVENVITRTRPLARALFAQAVQLRVKAHLKRNLEHRIPSISVVFPNQEMLRVASTLAKRAADFVPDDDQRKQEYLELSLRCTILAGGVSVGELIRRSAEAERYRVLSEAFFGYPERRVFDARRNRIFLDSALEILLSRFTKRSTIDQEDPLARPSSRAETLKIKIEQPPLCYGERSHSHEKVLESLTAPALGRFMAKRSISRNTAVELIVPDMDHRLTPEFYSSH